MGVKKKAIPKNTKINPVTKFLRQVKRKSEITYDDIQDYFRDEDFVSENLDDILISLERKGVIVLDDSALDNNTAVATAKPRKKSAGDSDIVRVYLKQIGQYDLLKFSDEQKITRKIHKLRFQTEKLKNKWGLDPAGIKNLLKSSAKKTRVKLPDGKSIPVKELKKIKGELATNQKELDELKDIMVRSNLRLVVSVAKRYLYRGLPLLDLISEGNLGLIKTVDRFDPRKKFRFGTYATWWIRQAITRALVEQSRIIRLPAHISELVGKWARASRELEQKLGRDPVPQEIAEVMNVPVERVMQLIKMSREPDSLDSPLSYNMESDLSDLIEDVNSLSPETYAQRQLMITQIEKLIGGLKPKEKFVIRLRMGLIDSSPEVLDELIQFFSIDKKRMEEYQNKISKHLAKKWQDEFSRASLVPMRGVRNLTAMRTWLHNKNWKIFKKFFSRITEQEFFYIEVAMGYFRNETFTLEEVGKLMKVTRERVRQIETRALRKLRYKIEVNKDMMNLIRNW